MLEGVLIAVTFIVIGWLFTIRYVPLKDLPEPAGTNIPFFGALFLAQVPTEIIIKIIMN